MLSVEHGKKGLFTIDVLGWEEILALMVSAPEVIADFYPEHADHLPELIEALRALPSLKADIATLVGKINTNDGSRGTPQLLLETLALRFGFIGSSVSPAELEAFLHDRSVEFTSLQSRLSKIEGPDGDISTLVASADAALRAGDLQHAEDYFQEAEEVRLTSVTITAVAKQSELRVARAQAALLFGDVGAAATHWAVAATYFQPFDRDKEAEMRYAACDELRGHGFRYRSVPALLSAEAALLLNQEIWTPAANLKAWCRTTNALGATRWRLAQFDEPAKFEKHIAGAKHALEAVRAACSRTVLPYYFTASSGNLANLYYERPPCISDHEYASNVSTGIDMQLQVVGVLSKEEFPLEWGILHHNIGTSYTLLARALVDQSTKLDAWSNSVAHLEMAFEVRDSKDSLQYWLASSTSLAEALIDQRLAKAGDEGSCDVERARIILENALAEIDEAGHPHQWSELQNQVARLSLDKTS